jgi:hypothetical protein
MLGVTSLAGASAAPLTRRSATPLAPSEMGAIVLDGWWDVDYNSYWYPHLARRWA